MSSSKYIHSHDYLYEIVGCYGCVSLLHLVYKQFCLVLYCDHSPVCLRFLDCQEHHWKTSCGPPLVERYWWEWKQQLEIWIYICIHLSQEQHQIPRILNLLVSLIPESSGHSWFSLLLFGIRIISSLYVSRILFMIMSILKFNLDWLIVSTVACILTSTNLVLYMRAARGICHSSLLIRLESKTKVSAFSVIPKDLAKRAAKYNLILFFLHILEPWALLYWMQPPKSMSILNPLFNFQYTFIYVWTLSYVLLCLFHNKTSKQQSTTLTLKQE